MFSKKILIFKHLKIAPENFQTDTWHLLLFIFQLFFTAYLKIL
jgi:hypothetical protein